MAFSLPNPTVPTNGQSLDASPVLANFLAIAQAIQAFDGSQITAGSIVAAAFNSSINPNTLLNETTVPFVRTGAVWSIVSALNGTMTGGTMYYNGIRVPVNSIATQAFTASKDTYVDIDVNGNVTYQAVTNNAASPSITANSIRVAIVVTSGAAITSINQGSTTATAPIVSSSTLTVNDSLGNLIYPTDPNGRILGYRPLAASFSTASTSSVQVTGLSCPVVNPVGRKLKITLFGETVYSNFGGTTTARGRLWDGAVGGGTNFAVSQVTQTVAIQAINMIVTGIVTPTTTNKTYNAGFEIGAGTGTLETGAAGAQPSFLLVELA